MKHRRADCELHLPSFSVSRCVLEVGVLRLSEYFSTAIAALQHGVLESNSFP